MINISIEIETDGGSKTTFVGPESQAMSMWRNQLVELANWPPASMSIKVEHVCTKHGRLDGIRCALCDADLD